MNPSQKVNLAKRSIFPMNPSQKVKMSIFPMNPSQKVHMPDEPLLSSTMQR